MLHELITGVSGSGKTTYSVKRAQEVSLDTGRLVTFIDTKGDTKTPWPIADRHHSLRDMRNSSFTFRPNIDGTYRLIEVEALVRYALQGGLGARVLVVDEAQEYAPHGRARGPLQDVATQGRSKGLTGLFICQAPQDISKTIVRQCDRVALFRQDEFFSHEYWRGKAGERYEEVERKMSAARQQGKGWPYVVIQGGEVTGPFQVDS